MSLSDHPLDYDVRLGVRQSGALLSDRLDQNEDVVSADVGHWYFGFHRHHRCLFGENERDYKRQSDRYLSLNRFSAPYTHLRCFYFLHSLVQSSHPPLVVVLVVEFFLWELVESLYARGYIFDDGRIFTVGVYLYFRTVALVGSQVFF